MAEEFTSVIPGRCHRETIPRRCKPPWTRDRMYYPGCVQDGEPLLFSRLSLQSLCTCFDASQIFCFQCDEQNCRARVLDDALPYPSPSVILWRPLDIARTDSEQNADGSFFPKNWCLFFGIRATTDPSLDDANFDLCTLP